ncbi:unannotated protein [freshwater metagenome]|uniref:Unannotated protein n=1 Tax=freshwater metagenome TaxID=449393 RepID=A0A6J6Z092_9ZZZZ
MTHLEGQTVRRHGEHDQQTEAADDREDDADVRADEGEDLLADAAGGEAGADEWAAEGTDATEHGVLQVQDRGDGAEVAELHDRQTEDQQDAGGRCDHAAEHEGIDLRPDDGDAERRGSAFVGAHRDQTPPGTAAAQVGDGEHHHDENDQAERRVPLEVAGDGNLDAEHFRVLQSVTGHAAAELDVPQDDGFQGDCEAECEDRQVDATGAHTGECQDQADGHGGQHASDEGEFQRPVPTGGEECADQRAETAHGHLCQRDLAGVAGDHDERADDQADEQLDLERLDVGAWEHEPDQEERHDEAEQHQAGRNLAGAECGHAAEALVLAGDGVAASDEVDGDEQEGNCCGPARGLDVAGDERLRHAKGDASAGDDRERRELADDRGGEDRHHQECDVARPQPGDRHEHDHRQTGERSADGPVDCGDRVRRHCQRGSSARILGNCGGGDTECGVVIDRPEHEGDHDHHQHDDHAVLAHCCAEHRHRPGRQQATNDPRVPAVAPEGDAGDRDHQRQRGDDAGELRCLPHTPQDEQVEQPAQRRSGQQPGEQREVLPGGGIEAVLHAQFEVHVRAQHADGHLGEVDDTRPSIDEHETDRGECVEPAGSDTEQREAEDVHLIPTFRNGFGQNGFGQSGFGPRGSLDGYREIGWSMTVVCLGDAHR